MCVRLAGMDGALDMELNQMHQASLGLPPDSLMPPVRMLCLPAWI